MTREDDYWTIVSGGRTEQRRRRLEHRDRIVSHVYTLLAVQLLLGGLAIICTPPLNQWVTDGRLTATAQAAQVSAATATDPAARLEAADEYNRRLAVQQVQIGEIIRADGTRDADFKDDTEYQSLLRLDATGTMGVLSIPAIGVELPIRHGTGADVLDNGLGHVHGTSLPVGGKNTRTVVSGHTNMEPCSPGSTNSGKARRSRSACTAVCCTTASPASGSPVRKTRTPCASNRAGTSPHS